MDQLNYETDKYEVEAHFGIVSTNPDDYSIGEPKLAGVICCPINGEFGNLAIFEQLKSSGIPLVTVDKRVWLPHGSIPCVTTDNRRAMYEMTSWLIEKMGHRRIAYCCARFTQANARYRFKGYVEALSDHGIPYDAALTDEMERPVMPYRPSSPDYAQYLSYLMSLPEPPTVIVCECDYVAFALIKRARALGISIPERVSVVGFDNVDMCELLEAPLTLFGARLIERASVRKIES